MKKIFATIEYVVTKIAEAITGHKNDTNAHPNLNEQIGILKEARSLQDIGLSDADMSPTDFSSNLVKILNAMAAYKVLKFWVYNTTPNLLSSITADAVVKSTAYGLVVEKMLGSLNLANKVIIRPDTTNGQVREQWGFMDNSWSGFKEVATTSKTEILFPCNTGYELDTGRLHKIYKCNNKVTLNLSIARTTASSELGAIGTLPIGYRPTLTVNGLCRLYGGSNAFKLGFVEISTNGVVQIQHDTGASQATKDAITRIWGSIEFYID